MICIEEYNISIRSLDTMQILADAQQIISSLSRSGFGLVCLLLFGWLEEEE